ncbi:MAG: translation elongation factor 4 [Alphaproteobacteria bacterium]|nr:translation elongation factor 4 [Alphaproteobacteria bacterium]
MPEPGRTHPVAHIRNVSVIAHIDHGKSTLADRLIERAGALEARSMRAQVLDSMDLERERGITIKAQTVRLAHEVAGTRYLINLIDTPGHVDFTYEVSRSLAASEGSVLVVDATQGVEAQTIANAYLAVDNDHTIIPVLNKIDLAAADEDRVRTQIEDTIGLDSATALSVSAKTGAGIDVLLDTIVERIPPPVTAPDAPLAALLVDSWYDTYLGVMVLVRVVDGILEAGQKIRMMASGADYQIDRVGIFEPTPRPAEALAAGEVGFFTASIRQVSDTQVGDTITDARRPADAPLPGFRESVPVVFCGLYPADASDYRHLRDSLAKLHLNDASVHYEPESSAALGLGFRCGCLGLLHLEIIQERLEREFGLDLVTTAPSVVYRLGLTDGRDIELHNPVDWPDQSRIRSVEEPWIRATILVPDQYLGNVLKLCTEKRGAQTDLTYVGSRAMVVYALPLNEVVFDFYDRLKSATSGYASFDYELDDYRAGDLARVAILVDGQSVDSLSFIAHRSRAEGRGRALCAKLKGLIPRQLYKVSLQAAIGGKIIARETIAALRKDVTAKCYGGDVTRKRKLLEKQKAGKKRMRQIGNVEIPQSAMLAVLRAEEP